MQSLYDFSKTNVNGCLFWWTGQYSSNFSFSFQIVPSKENPISQDFDLINRRLLSIPIDPKQFRGSNCSNTQHIVTIIGQNPWLLPEALLTKAFLCSGSNPVKIAAPPELAGMTLETRLVSYDWDNQFRSFQEATMRGSFKPICWTSQMTLLPVSDFKLLFHSLTVEFYRFILKLNV